MHVRGGWMLGPCLVTIVGCSDAPALAGLPGPTPEEGATTTSGGTTDVPAPSSDGTTDGDHASGGGGGSGATPPDVGVDLLPPRFVDVTLAAGLDIDPGSFDIPPFCILDTVHGQPGETGDYCLPQRFIGAAAVADYDDDGWPDIYVTRFSGPDRLMRNQGDGTFEDMAAVAGLDADHASSGAAWVDVEGDGDLDLMLTTLGDNRYWLYINDGAGHFDEQGIARGAAVLTEDVHIGMSIAAGDYDRDGYLDLFVTDWRPEVSMGNLEDHNRLLHNLGALAPGYFEDVTAEVGIDMTSLYEDADASPGVYGFAPAFVDLDGDLWPELALTADFGTSRLFWNDAAGGFEDGTDDAGVGTDDNGMGSTFGDIDGDGDLDWFVSSIWTPDDPTTGNRMYLNQGDRTFTDITDQLGLRQGGWGWGTAMLDADHDGDLDLALASGWPSTPYADDPVRLWLNIGPAQWPDVAPLWGIEFSRQGRGLVPLDYDLDGDLDLLVLANVEFPALWRNDLDEGSWLQVKVDGPQGNRRGIGAQVRVQARPREPWQTRTIGVGSHLFGQQDAVAHFGLGQAGPPLHQLEITWPQSGAVTVLRDVERNQRLTVEP
ncbi:MAG: CRTAC1 family protein [Deltaproteobacteria bacterium]|nr:CRTAC1 family protein [Deltaproteobacteria bacterium]